MKIVRVYNKQQAVTKLRKVLVDNIVIYNHPYTMKTEIAAKEIVEYPFNVSKVKMTAAKDCEGNLWTALGSANTTYDEKSIFSMTEQQTVFSVAPTPHNFWIALQERNFRLLPVKPNVEACPQLRKAVTSITDILDEIEIPIFSIDSWIDDHRVPSGKTLDRPVYTKYQKWVAGDELQSEPDFVQYTYHNDKPKTVTSRMKMNEKNLTEAIKPRIYDVFAPIHAILAGPFYRELALISQEHLPGY